MTLVIDFFQGSGTTAEVAYRLGCLYIGVDEDPLAKDVATARVDKLKPAPLDFYKTKWKNALRWQIFVKDQTSVVVEVDDEAVGMCLYINWYLYNSNIFLQDYVYGLGKDNSLIMEQVDKPLVTSVASQESPQKKKARKSRSHRGQVKRRKVGDIEAEEGSAEEVVPDPDEGLGQGGEESLVSEDEKSDSFEDNDYEPPLTQPEPE